MAFPSTARWCAAKGRPSMGERVTTLSDCRKYRYTLWRDWPMSDGEERQGFDRERAYAMFIGLNPSTADEVEDDPTIRRCIGFAKSWGYGALCMTNLFAFRATNPKELYRNSNVVGAENDEWIKRCAKGACVVVAAWGKDGDHLYRDQDVPYMLAQLEGFPSERFKCFGRNKDGSPKHPLYLAKTTPLIPFWQMCGPRRRRRRERNED
jgi:hypothetical protein